MDAVNLHRLSLLIGLLIASPAMAVEFNLNVLDKSMRDSVDLTLLKNSGAIAPGDYFVTVTVNTNHISAGDKITWRKVKTTTQPCIPVALADKFGLTGGLWNSVAALNDNLGNAGFIVVGLFIVCWIASLINYRFKGYDALVVR